MLLSTCLFFVLIYKNWTHYSDEIPAFVQEYKKSSLYWSSAFIGGLYGSIGTPLEEYSSLIVLLIFVSPPIGYYIRGKPFGLQCKYSPIHEEKGLINSTYKKNNIAEFDDDECCLRFEVVAGRHIEEYELQFETPNNTEIRFVDYYNDKVQEYDPIQDNLIIEGQGKDSIAIGVYVEDHGYSSQGAEPFRVKQARNDETLIEITII